MTKEDDQCQCLQTSEAMLGKIITSRASFQPSFIQIANTKIGIIWSQGCIDMRQIVNACGTTRAKGITLPACGM